MNNENLRPTSMMSPDELSEFSKKGGQSSGVAKRRRINLKKTMDELMCLPNDKLRAIYEDVGGQGDPTNADIMLSSLLALAMRGDVPAIKQVREIIRDDDRLKIEQEKLKLEKKKLEQNDDGLDKLDEILDRIRGADDDKNIV